MAYEALDTLTFDNCTKVSEYNPVDRSIRVRQLEPAGNELVPAGTPERTYPPGFQIAQFRDGQDRLTQVAIAGSPYVRLDVEAGYYTEACDLTGEVVVNGTSVTLSGATSHPPIAYAITGHVLTPTATQYDNLGPGNYVASFEDANACRITRSFTIADPNPPANPNGLLIDTFTAGNGDLYSLYYQVNGNGRFIFVQISGTDELASVSEADRGYADGTLLQALCEGTTRVEFRSLTRNPFLAITTIANSTECGFVAMEPLNIDSVDPVAPAAGPPATGGVDVYASGGTSPLFAVVDGITTAPQPLVDGGVSIGGLAPGLYAGQVSDSSSSPVQRYF